MKIQKQYNALFSTTPISDLFFSDYLPELDPVCAKLYVYCVYLSRTEQDVSLENLAAALSMEKGLVGEKLLELQSVGLVSLLGGNISLIDPGQKELERFYRPRTVNAAENEESNTTHIERTQVIKAISDRFFAGQMPPSWYGEVDFWIEKYSFVPEVVYMLFQHCASNHVMTKPYVRKVAENWNTRGLRTVEQLEQYLKEYEEYKKMRGNILKKLKWNRNMNVYEEAIAEKWFFTYRYSLDIIEIALKKSVYKTNASLATFDSIIPDWFKRGFTSAEQIIQYEEERSKKYAAAKKNTKPDSQNSIAQKKNYEQRTYDEEFFEQFYKG